MRENSEVAELMIVKERELTGHGRYPFVGAMLRRVVPVFAVTSADSHAPGRAVCPGPWEVFR